MRKRAWGMVAVLVALAGCGAEEPSEAERQAKAERAIALVQRANKSLPPLREVTPEAIEFGDIERYDLFGAGCTFAPGTSYGTRVIAQQADAYIKLEGEIVRLGADSGARELPLNTRSRYVGREHELQLSLLGEGEQSGESTVDYEGTVTLRDAHGRVVYGGTGLAQCGS